VPLSSRPRLAARLVRVAVVSADVCLPLPLVAYAQGVDQPTAADVRAWSPPAFDWEDAGYPAPAPGDPESVALEKRVQWAVGEIESMTGRPFATIVAPDPSSGQPNLVPVAEKATVLKVILDVVGGTAAALAVLGAPWLRSFTAGSYSETRFSPAEMSGIQGRGSEAIGNLGPEPLATLLLMLMTDDKRADWLFLLTGRSAPASGYVAEDWGGDDCDIYGGLIFGPGVTHGWPWGP
jgi:hypothetical protein